MGGPWLERALKAFVGGHNCEKCARFAGKSPTLQPLVSGALTSWNFKGMYFTFVIPSAPPVGKHKNYVKWNLHLLILLLRCDLKVLSPRLRQMPKSVFSGHFLQHTIFIRVIWACGKSCPIYLSQGEQHDACIISYSDEALGNNIIINHE
jgi:hypothetical protein